MTTAAIVKPIALRPGGLVAGRFRLIERIGQGGMGEVWAAEQQPLQRKVALKLLNVEASARPDSLARFELEARALSRLDDPHVVRVLDFGRDDDAGFFLATEFLDGETLEALLVREQRLSAPSAVEVVAQMLEGLEAAHLAGIVHRDLKPANIMLVSRPAGQRVAKLLDFGIAKVFEQGGPIHLTEAGAVFGTPQYISPEQALCRPVDLRADLYACGVILFRALMGQLPFEGEEPGTLAMKHVTEPIPPLPADIVPPALAAIVRRAMSKDPRARDDSARAMRTALLEAVGATGVRPAGPPSLLPPSAARASHRVAPARARLAPAVRAILSVRLPPPSAPPEEGEASSADRGTVRLTGVHLSHQVPVSAPTLRMSVAIRGGSDAGLARSTVEAFGGAVARISEEGLTAVLASPTDALHCAAAIQDRLVDARRPPLRVAADVGEVEDGDALRGSAVDRAESLSARALTGEVLFTQAVYLSMARSEISCEQAGDAQVGQPVYRLQPSGLVRRPELPFGGGSLDRSRARPLDRLLRLGGRMVVAVILRASDLFGRIFGRVGRQLLRAMSARPVPAAAILLVLAALTALLLRTTTRDPAVDVQKAMSDGRLELARALAERWTRDLPDDGSAHAWLARVLTARGEVQAAATELQLAFDRAPELAERPEIVRVVAAALSGRSARTAQALALLHPTPAMNQVLFEAAQGDDDVAAYTAIETLRELGTSGQLLSAYSAKLDPLSDCASGRRSVERITVLGEAAAVPLLERLDAELEQQDPCSLRKPVTRALKALGAR